ncbi:hypothetical protein HMPREF6123_2485 [Oribacterium sinus F0268]|uniref:Uncharacterized protein n=1 Tax=Oribacterium sinus F0268 TaxID=585501 RepID=C2L166_9FIRM|nr:hypothetical protein HMPREF6123_2485 [Oribacterium sinus F0268]
MSQLLYNKKRSWLYTVRRTASCNIALKRGNLNQSVLTESE